MPKYSCERFKLRDAHCMEYDEFTQPAGDYSCERVVSTTGDSNKLSVSNRLSTCGFRQRIRQVNGFTRRKTWRAGAQPPFNQFRVRSRCGQIIPPCPQCQPPRYRSWSSQYLAASLRCIFIMFILLSRSLASPIHPHPPSVMIRQAVPDRSGNTGNDPAPVGSQPPPRFLTPTLFHTPSPAPSVISTANAPASTTTSTSAPPLPSGLTSPNGNANRPPGEVENDPQSPFAPLTLISPRPNFSPGAIAGLAGAGFVVLCIFAALGLWFYRNRPSANVEEIPIRRSKLSSRLGFRLFGEGGVLSRSGSRNESRSGLRRDSDDSNEGREKEVQTTGWLSKRIISRPKPMKGISWVENELLGVPKPAFLHEGRGQGQDTVAPWAQTEGGGKARPGRPKSAEPLGRLSGMGLGMGYLK